MPAILFDYGQRFRLLTVVALAGGVAELRKDGRLRSNFLWRCKCDCGNEVLVTAHNLLAGRVGSCGCLSKNRRNRRSLNE